MKGLLQTIVGEAVKKGYYYAIDSEEGMSLLTKVFINTLHRT